MSVTRSRVRIAAFAGLALSATAALAQARHPFAVGATETGAPAGAFGLWLLAEQSRFTHAITAALRSTRDAPGAFWTLATLSFGYGVLHAAGPGHGKAVMAAYMVANERALRRGLALTAAAAVLQALVAVALVAGLAMLLGATAARMTDAAHAIEIASYAAVAALGAWLVWVKGRAFARAVVAAQQPALALAGTAPSRFACEPVAPGHIHDATCGHLHAPDPAGLDAGFAWGPALGAVAAAGARPCSGAILVLVFALAQGLFAVGIAASLFMALGTALTTGVLAATAVFAKRLAVRLLGTEGGRAHLVARGAELAAALFVLAVGAALLFGSAVAQSVS